MRKRWGRKISDLGYGIFIEILEYLALAEGKLVQKVDRYFASSQICSNCGCKQKLQLNQRVYECKCGLSLDRDVNAAKNILAEGIRLCGAGVIPA